MARAEAGRVMRGQPSCLHRRPRMLLALSPTGSVGDRAAQRLLSPFGERAASECFGDNPLARPVSSPMAARLPFVRRSAGAGRSQPTERMRRGRTFSRSNSRLWAPTAESSGRACAQRRSRRSPAGRRGRSLSRGVVRPQYDLHRRASSCSSSPPLADCSEAPSAQGSVPLHRLLRAGSRVSLPAYAERNNGIDYTMGKQTIVALLRGRLMPNRDAQSKLSEVRPGSV
jgi:hypothetical protein